MQWAKKGRIVIAFREREGYITLRSYMGTGGVWDVLSCPWWDYTSIQSTNKPTICILMFYTLQFSSVAQLCPTLWDPMNRTMPGLPAHHHLPEFTQTHVHWVGDAIQPPHPLSSPSPPALNLSQHQGLLKWVSSSHQVAKELEFQLQHQSFQRIFRIDFFRMDWLDLLAVQGTLKSLLQHHSSKASVLQRSAFFIVQLSHPYMTTGKTIALTRQTFVDKAMSLLFNMLSRLVIAFLPRRKHLNFMADITICSDFGAPER